MCKKSNPKIEYPWKWFLVTISALWVFGVIFLLEIQGYPKNLNELGDFIAGAASPLAFFWLVYGFFMQSNELRLQRETLETQNEELNLQKNELSETKTTLKQQTSTLKKQQFESTFFSMLKVLEDIVSSIEFSTNVRKFDPDVLSVLTSPDSADKYERVSYKGTDAVEMIARKHLLNQIYSSTNLLRFQISNYSEGKEYLEHQYFHYWNDSAGPNIHSKFAHYFRYLRWFLTFIAQSDTSSNNSLYIKILRAQLSDYEQLILFFNCLYFESKNLKPFVKDYILLENMPKSVLSLVEDEGTDDPIEDQEVHKRRLLIYAVLMRELEILNGNQSENDNSSLLIT